MNNDIAHALGSDCMTKNVETPSNIKVVNEFKKDMERQSKNNPMLQESIIVMH